MASAMDTEVRGALVSELRTDAEPHGRDPSRAEAQLGAELKRGGDGAAGDVALLGAGVDDRVTSANVAGWVSVPPSWRSQASRSRHACATRSEAPNAGAVAVTSPPSLLWPRRARPALAAPDSVAS
jgi:hypothetical protein